MGRAAWVLAAAALGGCASSVMGGFVGKPVESVMARYGPPALVFDMPDGRRAFQWRINNGAVIPGAINSTANIYAPPGSLATVTSSTTYMPAQRVERACFYTMYARQDRGAWTLVGYEKPNFMCE